jgi:hypothetical protein
MKLPKTKEELYDTYFLKGDLVKICREHNFPINGSKKNLLEYISNFIENKPVETIKVKNKIKNNDFEPLLEKIIGAYFKFNVTFMNWMEENKGKKTYKNAIEIYNKILLDKKFGRKIKIRRQFKYNQYTRDFFENNQKLSREDCIKCWNYKKEQKGKHKYEKDDLKVLENIKLI